MAEQQTPVPSGDSPVANVDSRNGLNGVKGEEANGVNGVAAATGGDDMNIDSPVDSIPRHSDSRNVESPDSAQPPPAKRARKLSDAEQASLAHVSMCSSHYAHLWRADCLAFQVPRPSASTKHRNRIRRPICYTISPCRTESNFKPSSAPILHLDSPKPAKAQRRWTLPFARRSRCFEHPSLSQYHQASHGFCDNRAQAYLFKPRKT